MGKRNIDLTRGTIWKVLILFFLPILGGNFFQQLYATADAIIVGKFAGKNGLAAIESILNMIKLPVIFLIGLSTGATIILSQYLGSGKEKELSKGIHTAVTFAFIGGLVASVLGIIIAPTAIEYMKVPDDIFSDSLAYTRVYFAGIVVSMIYNIGSGILRALGDSTTPFYVLIVAGVTNVVLDLIFVAGLDLGVAGAALATVVAESISAVLVVKKLCELDGAYRLHIKELRIHTDQLKKFIHVGLPIGIQSSLYPIANILIQTSINNTGTDNIAAWAVCGKIDFPIWIITDSLALAIATFVAQNYGAGLYDRLHKGVRLGLWMTVGIIGAISAVLYIWCRPIGTLFIKQEDLYLMPLVVELMRFLSPMYIAYVFGVVYSNAIRGTGESLKPMLIGLFGICAVRIIWIKFVVGDSLVLKFILWSFPLSWFINSILFIVYWYIFSKKFKKASN